jgi:FMN phosphatase YigB (HAD superfamily)
VTPSIIFDFDGTLTVGDGPVLAFAREAAPAAGARFLERVEGVLGHLKAGSSRFLDGYDLVSSLAAAEGIDRVLSDLNARASFDEFHFAVGKPEGLSVVVRRALAAGPVLAVGNIFDLDLAPAQAAGADTALVGANTAICPAPVTMRGRTLADLRSEIETWTAAAAAAVDPPRQQARTPSAKGEPEHAQVHPRGRHRRSPRPGPRQLLQRHE